MEVPDDRTVFLVRPVTVESVAEALGWHPFEVMKHLVDLEVFLAPTQGMLEEDVETLGKRFG